MYSAAQLAFPNAVLYLPLINYSKNLPPNIRQNVSQIKAILRSKDAFIQWLERQHFHTTKHNVHWTPATAKSMWKHLFWSKTRFTTFKPRQQWSPESFHTLCLDPTTIFSFVQRLVFCPYKNSLPHSTTGPSKGPAHIPQAPKTQRLLWSNTSFNNQNFHGKYPAFHQHSLNWSVKMVKNWRLSSIILKHLICPQRKNKLWATLTKPEA